MKANPHLDDARLEVQMIRRTRRRMLRWGRANFREFVWRQEQDPWLALVAEFFLQRTRASQIADVFVDFKERFPTASSVAGATESDVGKFFSRLGLRWRGPLLIEIAKEVAARNGRPPDDTKSLQAMRGIGGYTAAAWLSLHRGVRAVIIDANVCRWLNRMTGLPYNRDPRGLRWVNDMCESLTPPKVFRDYNYAVLDFTMTVCTRSRPGCSSCPLRSDCLHSRTGSMP